MRPVTLDVNVSDLCDATIGARCEIVSVASSEPDNGLGDGDTAGDWLITGPLTLELRAERAGRGSGRTYEIAVRCTDVSGNATTTTTTVVVPRDRR
jgi:hypothetical protein